MKKARMILTVALMAAMAAFGEDYDPAKHGNPIRVLSGELTIDGHNVTIDAKGRDRCATLGPNVTLKNFTFRGGKAAIGGGVYGGRIEACTVTGCSASESAAALAHCVAVDCQIVGNTFANGSGTAAAHGGLFYGSSLTRCTVRNNAVTFGSEAPAFGGIGEAVTMTGCTVEKNTVSCGERICYGTLYAHSAIDGEEIEFRDVETAAPADPTEEDPQPPEESYDPEVDPVLAVGEGIVNRYYAPAYLDQLDASGVIRRSYDKKTTVKAEGLPKGLKLAKETTNSGYRYWIEGVPTETLDGETRLAYVRVTDAAKNVTFRPLANLRIVSATAAVFPAGTNKVEYWRFPVSKIWPDYAGNESNWSFSGWPTGLKFATKATTYNGKAVKAGRVYGTPTKVDVFTVKAVEKIVGTSYKSTHTATFRIHYGDGEPPEEDDPKPTPGFELQTGDLSETVASVRDIRVGVAYAWAITNTVGSTVTQSGLPTGLKLSSVKDKSTKVTSYSVTGVPTKEGSFLTTFTTKLNGVSSIQTVAFNVAALPSWAVGTFNGFATNAVDKGSATLTASRVGKLSGKVILGGKSWSFSQSGYASEAKDARGEATAFTVAATAKNGKSVKGLSLTVGADGIVGAFEDDYDVCLWRNVWKDAGESTEDFAGYYTAQLIAPDEAVFGHGYLTLTVDKKGNCKAGGKLPDGTAISGSLPLVPSGDGLFAIWSQFPSACKGGYAFGLLSLDGAGSVASQGGVEWVSENPQATGEYDEGFRRTLNVKGRYYEKDNATTTTLATESKEIAEEDERVKSFSMTKGTGVFKMTIYDPEDEKGSKTLSVAGVVVQGAEEVFGADLRGYYLVARTGAYLSGTRKKTYTYKESVPVVIAVPEKD